jgi:23S rRNA pseudouridine2605 synthase
MTAERLQKVLARAGIGSRRKVEEMIRAGRITVDGRIAELGERADLEVQAVKVDGRRVQAPRGESRYLLVNKPGGYVSTVSDPEGRPTVLDLLPQRLRQGLKPVGRLDYATEGLLLLTDDGDFAQHVAHPRFGCAKTYEAKVKGHPSDAALDKLRRGVVLEGKRTAPAEIRPRAGRVGARESVESSWWTVTLSEGRTRQIREMFARAGHPVKRLRRVAIGTLADRRLPRGAWRELSAAEVAALRRKTARVRPPTRAPRTPRRKRTSQD